MLSVKWPICKTSWYSMSPLLSPSGMQDIPDMSWPVGTMYVVYSALTGKTEVDPQLQSDESAWRSPEQSWNKQRQYSQSLLHLSYLTEQTRQLKPHYAVLGTYTIINCKCFTLMSNLITNAREKFPLKQSEPTFNIEHASSYCKCGGNTGLTQPNRSYLVWNRVPDRWC